MTESTIVIAKDFSVAPAGRHLADGPFSGERFREQFLIPTLSAHEIIVVDLDGTLGYGSSFLEEAFGGLVRVRGMPVTDVRRRIKIKSSRRFYEARIWSYVEAAGKEKKK